MHLTLWMRVAALLAMLAAAGPALAATDTFGGGTVANCTYAGATQTYSCSALSASNNITIASGYTVQLSGSAQISATLTMSGGAALRAAGSLDLSSATMHLTGGTLAAAGAMALGAQTFTADIVVGGALSIDNHAGVTGSITAGTISTGNHVTLTGNVIASGDLDLGNHAVINGNLAAHDVVLENAFAFISGNAAVNAITLGTKGTVGGTITCTGAGASGCSCVTDNSHTTPPSCGAAPASGPDHILITHGGTALTCQPQTVTITACANAACTAPHYASSVGVTLAPGGQNFTISGGVNNGATVQQTTAGNAILSASGANVSNPSTCHSTATNDASCNMAFSNAGLSFPVQTHRSEVAQTITVSALQQGGNSAVCVPMLANTTQSVNFRCAYNNPNGGFLPVRIANTPLAANAGLACSGGGANINLVFDANGQASTTLQYADVGSLNLNAGLTPSSGAYAGVTLSGATSFTVAPYQFLFTIQNGGANNPGAADETGTVFIAAGRPFQATLSAVNAAGAITQNFGQEASPETVTINQDLVGPGGGKNPAISPPLGALRNGTTGALAVSWPEVGIFSWQAGLTNTNGYLGNPGAAGLSVSSALVNVGRFVPDHFDTTLSDTTPMNCSLVTGAAKPCPSPNGNGKFVYSRQGFGVGVTAYSASGSVTENYAGVYAKNIQLTAWNGAGAMGGANQIPPNGVASSGIFWANSGAAYLAAANFAATATPAKTGGGATTPAANLPGFQFSSNATDSVGVPTNLYLRATELNGDGVSSLRAAGSTEALISVVSGRQQFGNNYGSETSPMPIVVKAQYWSGGAWLFNPAYDYAAFTLAGKLTGANCVYGLASAAPQPNNCNTGFSAAGAATLAYVHGIGRFTLATPALAAPWHKGAVDLGLSAGTIPYLPGGVGRATFGVYRSGPVVYLREVY